MATQAAAGWYDDGTGKQRWWDGARWTEHYIDLGERDTELHIDAAPAVSTGTAAGWYDDGRGRLRWWDGSHWTDATRFSGDEEALAGIVVDGRWIHFGPVSQRVVDANAAAVAGAELLRRGRLAAPATHRSLIGPQGVITPRLLKSALSPNATYLVVEVSGQVWLATVPTGQEAAAGRFATWINSVSEHYRYR
ncbi:DUF2510 domain-containing protein [Microbacterium sp. HJ5]